MQIIAAKYPESSFLFSRREGRDQILVAGAGTFAAVVDGKLHRTPISYPNGSLAEHPAPPVAHR